uniref:Col_cuticle_N domain-containing protein n=1 Tax=Heterorhabditis bacteriophora TaxID=37862 RepID=A0A1I7XJJ6_HETBA
MRVSPIEMNFLISLIISSIAVSVSLMLFPLLQEDLEILKTDVLKGVSEFKLLTDSVWNDLMEMEKNGNFMKRDTLHMYTFKPILHRKTKPHPLYSRVYGQPTVIANPGRTLFTDSGLIGKPGNRKLKFNKLSEHQLTCTLKLDSSCQRGPTGPPGKDGLAGVPGQDGEPGIPGINIIFSQNERSCIQCPSGSRGPPGERGVEGKVGENGQDGSDGIYIGLTGSPGPIGEPGKQGVAGLAGPPGEPGHPTIKWICPPGEKGSIGLSGREGLIGPRGSEGVVGIHGIPGRHGKEGEPGIPGLNGRSGPRGKPGRNGIMKLDSASNDNYGGVPDRQSATLVVLPGSCIILLTGSRYNDLN